MKQYLQYIRIQMKRTRSLIPRFIGALLLVSILAIVSLVSVSAILAHIHMFEPAKVGIVIPSEEDDLKVYTQLISRMDSVKNICKFVYMDEEEAKLQLNDNKLQAVIIIPKRFVQDVIEGINTKATILLGADHRLNTKVFYELIDDGITLVQTGEAAVYSVTEIAYEYEMRVSMREMENIVSYLFLEKAMNRTDLFDQQILSATGAVDLATYYFVQIVLVLLLFAGLSFGYLFTNKEYICEKKLRVYGIGPFKIHLVKIIIISLMDWGIINICYLAAILLAKCTGILSIDFHLTTVILLYPVSFSIASFTAMFYTWGNSTMQNGMILLLTNFCMVLIGGCIFPESLLPAMIRKVGHYLPVATWSNYLIRVFTEVTLGSSFTLIVMIGLLVFMIGVFGKCKNTYVGT